MTATDGRVDVPWHQDAERALIGAVLLRPDIYTEALTAGVTDSDFYHPAHRTIWRAIANLADIGVPVDVVTVGDELQAEQNADQLRLLLLDCQRDVPATGNWPTYATKVIDASRLRTIAGLAEAVKAQALDGQDPTDTLDLLTAATQPRAPEATRLELRWVDHALDNPPPEPPVLVDGFVRAGGWAVIVAPKKIGKSWLSMQLALLIARGEGQFLGRLAVRQQAKVLLAQGELDQWGSYARWKHLTAGAGRPPDVAETFDRWKLKVQTTTTTSQGPQGTRRMETYEAILDGRLEATIVDQGFGLLLVDPWAVFYRGQENSNDQTEAALDELRALAVRTGCAVVLIHHIGKGGTDKIREPEDLWRGAGRLGDWAQTGLTMMPHYHQAGGKNGWEAAGLTRQKAKWFVDLFFMRRDTPTEDFSVAWNPANGWWDAWEPTPRQPVERPAGFNPTDVADRCPPDGWPSIRLAATDLGLSPDTAARRLAEAARHGLLETFAPKGGGKGYRRPARSLFNTPLVNAFTNGVPVDAYEGLADDEVDDRWDDSELDDGYF